MAKADRIVAERARAEAAAAEREQKQKQKETNAREAVLRQELKIQIPRALARLEAKGFPGAQMMKVPLWETRRGGYRGPSIQRAAWVVHSYDVWMRDGYITHHIYLLGNGQLSCGRPNDLSGSHLSGVLAGVRGLGQ